ncbi:unnamed protein product [Colias eurytheme]|nr:unnamed protein product [Colias eurytheme]
MAYFKIVNAQPGSDGSGSWPKSRANSSNLTLLFSLDVFRCVVARFISQCHKPSSLLNYRTKAQLTKKTVVWLRLAPSGSSDSTSAHITKLQTCGRAAGTIE